MRFALALAAGIGLAALSVTATHAQDQKKRERPKLDAAFFKRLDTNKDGVVTLSEIPEDRQEQAKRLLERLDTNKDGKITREEFNAGIDKARPRGNRPEEAKPEKHPVSASLQSERRPDEPSRPSEGQPSLTGAPGRPPFGAGGPDLFRALDTDKDGKLSKDELAKAAEILMKLDKNGDGLLSPDELAEGIRGPRPDAGPVPPAAYEGRRPEMVAGMIKRMDKNGDGKLSKDELPEMLRDRFEQIDTNMDGFVDEKELAQAGERLRKLRGDSPDAPPFPGRPGAGAPGRPSGEAAIAANRERIAQFLREHDKDSDGRISLKEFGEDRHEEYKKLDANGDGFLTPDELARGLQQRGDDVEGRRRLEASGELKKKDSPKD